MFAPVLKWPDVFLDYDYDIVVKWLELMICILQEWALIIKPVSSSMTENENGNRKSSGVLSSLGK